MNDAGKFTENLKKILYRAVEMKASDVHLTAGLPPMVRVYGELSELDVHKLKSADIEAMVFPLLDEYQKDHFRSKWELDFSCSVPDSAVSGAA